MFWGDYWKLAASVYANGIALSETMVAANSVIGKRSQTIDTALRNPMAADVGELGRMLPEKLAAFGQAGLSLSRDWAEIHREMIAQSADLFSLWTSPWPPKSKTLTRIVNRGARLSLQISTAGGRALAPVHAAATNNDRRLSTTR